MGNPLEYFWMKLTDKNPAFLFPGYYWIYIFWAFTTLSFYLLQEMIGVVYFLLAIGASFLLIRILWWAYRTIPFRIRVWRRKRRTARWRKKEAKTYPHRVFSPGMEIQRSRKPRVAYGS